MINKYLAMLIVLSLTFLLSCAKQSQSSMEDDYISKIEEEYKKSSGSDVVAEINNGISFSSSNDNTVNGNVRNTVNNNVGNAVNDNNQFNRKQINNASEYNSVKPKRHLKATIHNFYSPWTSQDDPLIIKEIRVMIANKEYTKALNYINKLDIDNLPSDVDLGHLYQFKGIAYYFLSKYNKSNIALADECFKKVESLTFIEKFKPLSMLWNGMLYQTYSMDEVQLHEAINLFDRIITEYPRTRFANDAVFYKAVTMKKLGMPENEYNDLFLSIKRGGFVDTLVFSQVINDYVPADNLVDREMLK